jgi:hypothetical protein
MKEGNTEILVGHKFVANLPSEWLKSMAVILPPGREGKFNS